MLLVFTLHFHQISIFHVITFPESFLNGGWNKSFIQLHKDSTLRVYKKQGDSTIQGSIFMKVFFSLTLAVQISY